jgi:hypothetical protein
MKQFVMLNSPLDIKFRLGVQCTVKLCPAFGTKQQVQNLFDHTTFKTKQASVVSHVYIRMGHKLFSIFRIWHPIQWWNYHNTLEPTLHLQSGNVNFTKSLPSIVRKLRMMFGKYSVFSTSDMLRKRQKNELWSDKSYLGHTTDWLKQNLRKFCFHKTKIKNVITNRSRRSSTHPL